MTTGDWAKARIDADKANPLATAYPAAYVELILDSGRVAIIFLPCPLTAQDIARIHTYLSLVPQTE